MKKIDALFILLTIVDGAVLTWIYLKPFFPLLCFATILLYLFIFALLKSLSDIGKNRTTIFAKIFQGYIRSRNENLASTRKYFIFNIKMVRLAIISISLLTITASVLDFLEKYLSS